MFSLHLTTLRWQGFAQALIYLAGHPQCIQPLREEVEAIVEKEGWTKTALMKMNKVDSFLKEVQRMAGNNLGASLFTSFIWL